MRETRPVVHTDGGCRAYCGVGAWAYTIRYADGSYVEASGVAAPTTNNRMEMLAVIEALKVLRGQEIIIVADSEYVVKGITDWSWKWRHCGWTTSSGKEVMNRDLWEEMIALCDPQLVRFRLVRGHSGFPDNERCDLLCNEAMNAYMASVVAA